MRCAAPIPVDAEYARDLGYAAVRYLVNGGSSAMITIQGGEFQAIPFTEVIDEATGRGRLRSVDIETESYQVARDYMVRIGDKDFADEAWVAKLAEASNLSVQEFTEHFGKLAHQS